MADAFLADAAVVSQELLLPAVSVAVDALTLTQRTSARHNAVSNVIQHVAHGLKALLFPCSAADAVDLPLLSGVTATFAAGSATLIIGSPGSGKSTLLRALSGRLHSTQGSDRIRYNGVAQAELQTTAGMNLRRLAAYAPQQDQHQAFLTVRELFTFAHASCAAALPAGASATAVREHATRVDRVIQLLGLAECENTIIGNPVARGISGGQKRRVTIGEAFLSGSRVLAADQITDGLDSAVALDVVRFLVRWARECGGTFVTALQAPTPEVFASFDSVLLLAEGRVLFHGPPALIEPYLFGAGYAQPNIADTADWAVQVATSPSTALQLYADDVAELGAPAPVSTTIAGLADHWDRSGAAWVAAAQAAAAAAASNGVAGPNADPAAPASPSRIIVVANAGGETTAATAPSGAARVETAPQSGPASVGAASHHHSFAARGTNAFAAAQYGSTFAHSIAHHTRLLVGREGRLYVRNKALIMAKLMQSVVMAAVFGGIFFQVEEYAFFLKVSIAFFACIFISYGNMAEVATTSANKHVVKRHLEASMYPSWSYTASLFFVQLPVTLIADLLFAAILYFMVGMDANAGRFFFWAFVLLSMDLCMSGLFKLYAILGSEETAGVMAGAGTGLMLIYGGFFLPRQQLLDPGYQIPFYYFSPFSWALRSLSLNEFFSDAYALPFPGGGMPGGPPAQSWGQFSAGIFGFWFEFAWKISGPFVLLGYYILFGVAGCSLALSHGRAQYAPGTRRIPEEEIASGSAHAAAAARAMGEKSAGTPTSAAAAAAAPGSVINASSGASPAALAKSAATSAATGAASTSTGGGSGSGSLPFTPATLAFDGITYTVVNPRTKQQLTLLRGISAVCRPGTMTALMGASGAGKTTLLDVLANRKTSGVVGGTKRVNGHAITPFSFARISGFSEQEDLHMPTTTVREALAFSATLRLEADVTPAQRDAHVEEVLRMLELSPLANRLVGTLAPGELKRLTLGVELASAPAIIFADEPTSGLDSRAAASVVRALRAIADSGRTVIATIHQPSSAVFLAFSNLLLLSPGGWQVYEGPIGHHARALVSYLQAVPGIAPLAHKVNPASWMLEATSALLHTKGSPAGEGAPQKLIADAKPVVSSAPATAAPPGAGVELSMVPVAQAQTGGADADPTSPAAATTSTPTPTPGPAPPLLARVYAGSALRRETEAGVAVGLQPGAGVGAGEVTFATLLPSSFGLQLYTVWRRAVVDLWRNPGIEVTRVFVYAFIAIFFAMTFLNAGHAVDQVTSLGKLGLLFSTGVFAGIAWLNTGLPGMFKLRPIFYRERAANFYVPESYALASMVKDLPFLLFFVLLFASVSYFADGLAVAATPFFTYVLALVLLLLYYSSIGLWLSAIMPNAEVAGIAAGIIISLTNLFGGVNIPPSQLAKGWLWMYYIDGISHYLRLTAMSQFDCSVSACPTFIVSDNGATYPATPYSFAAARLDTTFAQRWESAGWLLLISIVFNVLAVVAYRRVNHMKR